VGIWDVSRCWTIRLGEQCAHSHKSAPLVDISGSGGDVFAFDQHEEGPGAACAAGGGWGAGAYVEFMGAVREGMSVNAAVLEWAKKGHGDGRTGVPAGHWDTRRAARSEWLRVFTASGTGTWDRVIRVFTGPVDGRRCTQTGTLKGHEDHVHSLVILPEREWLLSASADRTLRLWCTTDLSAVSTRHRHGNFACAIMISIPDDGMHVLLDFCRPPCHRYCEHPPPIPRAVYCKC
jgi:hypothetical protein